jgi:hypothetical protein
MKIITIYHKDQWIGFDLDGTIAEFDSSYWARNINYIGDPIPHMIQLIKKLLANDIRIKIFTARASRDCALPAVTEWIKKHIGIELEVTNVKDFDCVGIIDDIAFNVEFNTGKFDEHIIISKCKKILLF